MKVTCLGKEGERTIEASMGESIGRLKHAAVSAFECPVEYTIYHKGAFLTKAIFDTLQEGDSVNLAEPTPKPESA